jgi:hypothetical protein
MYAIRLIFKLFPAFNLEFYSDFCNPDCLKLSIKTALKPFIFNFKFAKIFNAGRGTPSRTLPSEGSKGRDGAGSWALNSFTPLNKFLDPPLRGNVD